MGDNNRKQEPRPVFPSPSHPTKEAKQNADRVDTLPYFLDLTLTNNEPLRIRSRELVTIEGLPEGGAKIEVMNEHRSRTYRVKDSAATVKAAHATSIFDMYTSA